MGVNVYFTNHYILQSILFYIKTIRQVGTSWQNGTPCASLGKAYTGLLLCPCDFHHKPAQRDTSRSNLLKIKLTDDHIVNTTQKRNFLISMNPLLLLNIIIFSVYAFACHFNRAIVAITWGNNVSYSNVILGVKCNTLRRSKMALGGKMKHWHIGRQLL